MKKILANSHANGGIALRSGASKGAAQPPRNMTVARVDTRIMLAYSPRKNSAKGIPEYSTSNPATISDSPSATSNGARLVSATPEMKYTISSGNSQNQFQARNPPCWRSTMSPRFRLCEARITPTSAKPIAISYATICAAERIAPRKAYLELAAQPAMMTPYTPIEVSDNRYNKPALAFDTTTVADSGTTAHAANAGISVIMGARRNRNLFAFAGMITSFMSSFTTSAKGCPRPGNIPSTRTRFGPRRNCIQPMTFLSHSVNNATDRMRTIVMARVHTVVQTVC